MSAETNFNYIIGGLSILTIVYSAHVILNRFLPSTQMEFFDSLLSDTKDIYTRACAESLLSDDFSRTAKVQLQKYEGEADVLRVVRYRNSSFMDFLIVSGRWNKIAYLKKELMDLRRKLVTASQEERDRRKAEEDGAALDASSIPHTEQNSQIVFDIPQSRKGPVVKMTITLKRADVHAGNPFAVPPSSSNHCESPPGHCSVCIYSLVQSSTELLGRTSSASSISDVQPQDEDGHRQSESEFEAPSRSSTLVENPPPRIPFWRRSFTGKWFSSGNAQSLTDLEEAIAAPRPACTTILFDDLRARDEPLEMDITSTLPI